MFVCSFGCVRCDACLVVRYFTFVRCSAYLVFPTLCCVRYKYVTRLVRQFALSAVQCLFGRSLFQIRRYSVVYVWLHAPFGCARCNDCLATTMYHCCRGRCNVSLAVRSGRSVQRLTRRFCYTAYGNAHREATELG